MKNAPRLFMSARQSKNGVLTKKMWNIIDPSYMFRLIDLINIMLFIPNIQLANPVVFLFSSIKVLSCCNAFNWPILPINQVEIPKSMNSLLNLVSLYCKLVEKLKT